MAEYVCIGVPYVLGDLITTRNEVYDVRASGVATELDASWLDVTPDFAPGLDRVVAVNRSLAQAIAAHPDRVPLIFAADCTNAFGAMKGLEAHRPAVVWLDAHGDFNTHETTPSGFLGGMPLAMLVGRGEMTYMDGVGLTPTPEHDVLISDARDLDPAEGDNLRASAVRHLPHVADLLSAPLPAKPLYLHLDVDVVDPAEMPGMSYPAPGGPSVDEVAAAARRIGRDGEVAGALFSLWDADLAGDDDRALSGTLALVRALVDGIAQRQ